MRPMGPMLVPKDVGVDAGDDESGGNDAIKVSSSFAALGCFFLVYPTYSPSYKLCSRFICPPTSAASHKNKEEILLD